MLAGEIYSAVDPQLIEELTEVKADYPALLLRLWQADQRRQAVLCQLQLHSPR